MQDIVLIVHLIIAIFLIAVVLLQRSEGGALGIGGGGNLMSGRGAATALQKATWGLAGAFLITSLTLTFFAFQQAEDQGLGLGRDKPAVEQPGLPAPSDVGSGGGDGLIDLTPEKEGAGGPALPPPIDIPALGR